MILFLLISQLQTSETNQLSFFQNINAQHQIVTQILNDNFDYIKKITKYGIITSVLIIQFFTILELYSIMFKLYDIECKDNNPNAGSAYISFDFKSTNSFIKFYIQTIYMIANGMHQLIFNIFSKEFVCSIIK